MKITTITRNKIHNVRGKGKTISGGVTGTAYCLGSQSVGGNIEYFRPRKVRKYPAEFECNGLIVS